MEPVNGYLLFKRLRDEGIVSRFTLKVLIAIATDCSPQAAYHRALQWALRHQPQRPRQNDHQTIARAVRWLAQLRLTSDVKAYERQCRQLRALFSPVPARPPP